MRIQGTSSSAELQQLQRVRQQQTSEETSESSDSGKASAVRISKPAEMMQKLTALQENDPAKFKAVVGEIADKLSEAAESADSEEAKAQLTKMSEAFSKAGQTGDLSALQPPERRAESRPPSSAMEAYKRNGPPPPPPPKDDAVKSAMDAALAKIDEATSDDEVSSIAAA